MSSAEVLDAAGYGAILVGEADAERVDLVFPKAEVDGQQGLTAVGIQAGELDVDPVEEGGVAHRGDVGHCRPIALADAEVVEEELLASDGEFVDVSDQGEHAFIREVADHRATDMDIDATDGGAVKDDEAAVSIRGALRSGSIDPQVLESALIAEGDAHGVGHVDHGLDVKLGCDVVGPQFLTSAGLGGLNTEEIVILVGGHNLMQRFEVDRDQVAGGGQVAWRDRHIGPSSDRAIPGSRRQQVEVGLDIALCGAPGSRGDGHDRAIVDHADVVQVELLAADFELLHVAGQGHQPRLVAGVDRRGDRHGHTRGHGGGHEFEFVHQQSVAIDFEVLHARPIEEIEADLGDVREGREVIDRVDVAQAEHLAEANRRQGGHHGSVVVLRGQTIKEDLVAELDVVFHGDIGTWRAVRLQPRCHQLVRVRHIARGVDGRRGGDDDDAIRNVEATGDRPRDEGSRREQGNGLDVARIVQVQDDLGLVISRPTVCDDFEHIAAADRQADALGILGDIVGDGPGSCHRARSIREGPLSVCAHAVAIVVAEFEDELNLVRGSRCRRNEAVRGQQLKARVVDVIVHSRSVLQGRGKRAAPLIPRLVEDPIGLTGRGQQGGPEFGEVAEFGRAGGLACCSRVEHGNLPVGEERVPFAVACEGSRHHAQHPEKAVLVLDAEVSSGEFAEVIRRGRCGRQDVIASRTGRPEYAIGQAPRVDAAGIHRNIHGNEGHLRLLIGLGEDVHRAIGEQGANQAEAGIGQDHGCGVRIDELWGHRLTGVEELAAVVIRDVEDHGVGDGGLQDLVAGGRAGALTEGGRCVVSTCC